MLFVFVVAATTGNAAVVAVDPLRGIGSLVLSVLVVVGGVVPSWC